MAYSVLADVLRMVPYRSTTTFNLIWDGTGTRPDGSVSHDDIEAWIAEADAVIDATLADGRVDPARLPILPGAVVADAQEGTDDYRRVMLMASVELRLRRLSAGQACARLIGAMPLPGRGQDLSDLNEQRIERLDMQAQRELAAIRANPGSVVVAAALIARTATKIEESDT